jgi:hypothetical protein
MQQNDALGVNALAAAPHGRTPLADWDANPFGGRKVNQPPPGR